MTGKRMFPCTSCAVNCYSLFMGVIYCSYFFDNGTSFETVQAYEGLPPGSAILNLNRNFSVAYTLYPSSATADGSALFYIDSNGILTSKVTLDYEDLRGNVFDLVVISREISKMEGGFGSIVRVRILDRNDNTPKFPKDFYTATVAENSPSGTYVSGLEGIFASDLDSGNNSVQNYSIVAGNEAGKFEVYSHELSSLKFLGLKTKAPIDREETPFFVLTVKVEDGGIPPLSSTTQIRVNILDENDQTPKFGLPIYTVDVSENVPVGTSVLKVNAFDTDIGTNAEIYYYFQPAHDFFTINAHTGTVETACELNFEKGNSFDLTVCAVDRGRNPRQAKTVVRIRLVDIVGFPPSSLGVVSSELTPPVFHKHKYFVRIREDFPVGGVIVRVDAHQGSRLYTQEKAWRYIILSKTSIQRIFHINPRSGVITLLEPLDYENKTSFSFTIKARDEQSKDLHVSQTRVEIVIQDVNENYFAPIFALSTSMVSVSENDHENSLVAKLSATDADEGSNGQITYSITGGSGLGKFYINKDNGKIRSLVPFNFVMASQFYLHVRATDRSKQPLHSDSFLLVRLRSSRQKRPHFFNPRQVVSVRENSPEGTFVALVRASVREGSREKSETPLEYFLSSGNQAGTFSLNSTSGMISTRASLDRESKDLYLLDIHARVKGADPSMSSPSQLVVMVTDENDNTPSFSQHEYKVVVPENMGPVSNLLCLAAHDPDAHQNGNITYSIISSTGPFSVDPVYGLLSADKSLDHEQKSLHRLVVQAADNGVPNRKTRTTVEILVQDANDAPVFSQAHYIVSVPEESDVEGTVTVLETSDQDRDKNGKFECSMEDMDLETMDTFSVRRIPEGCALVLRSFLDWSSANQYSFSVRATDQAEAAQRKSAVASVTIRVEDTNNHRPEFLQSSYWVSLPNDANIGTTVLNVKAFDLDEGDNARIIYKLSNDMFDIHPSKGVITVKQGLGSVANKKYEFSVRATDQGTPNRQSAVSVSVSVHSLSFIPPEFIKSVYRIVVSENFTTGVVLLTVHAQKNVRVRSSIEYDIVGGDPLHQFSVGTRSGVLTLRKSLDYERAKRYVLVVRAVQKGLSRDILSLPTEVKVFVNVTDVNDNYPRFALPRDPLVTFVNEFEPAGAVVATVKAFDKDTGDHSSITYGLKTLYNPYSGSFRIHPTLGTITTTKELLHSQGAARSFVVTATDSSYPFRKAEAKVIVMINRAIPPPKFDKEEFAEFVPENIEVGKSLVHFKPQQTARLFLEYKIVSGNIDDQWCVDTTGKIRVNKRLQDNQGTLHRLKITVHDAGSRRVYRGLSVVFNVEDVNDNVPKFSSNSFKFYISENLTEIRSIGTVSAADYDEESNALVRYSIEGVEDSRSVGKFAIDPISGRLKTTTALDREVMQQHVITVRAQDHGKPSLSSLTRVTVVVLDVNDNDPIFSTDVFSTWVPVDTNVGSNVFTVVAFDDDWGENGILRYSVVEGNAEQFITVDPADGSVILSRPLTSLKPIKFKVMARDLGNPGRNATADVVIRINAVAGPPRFLLPFYEARVAENERAGTEVIRLEVASVDSLISFNFLSGNEISSFHLQVETGVITTVKPLDYESVAQYELIVMATDSSNKMNYVKVVVHVENVNDNEPHFVGMHEGILEGQILADAIANSHVTWVKARDLDTSDVITYKILDKQAASYFKIDFEGRLRTRKVLAGLHSPFDFKIEALDSGIPSKRAFATVRLVLLRYHTGQKELQVTVAEDETPDATIIKMKDSAGIKNARFSIIYPVGSPFQINQKTGSLSSLRPLDFETTHNYSIIVQVQNSLDLNDYTNIDVVIKILDVNDNSPTFTMEKIKGMYLAKVNRNPFQGTVVYKLTASDRDSTGHLRYSLVTNDFNGFFEVEAESGNVKTRGQQGGVLTADVYNLTVRVSDSDTPSRHTEAMLTVQVGEYPPVFSEEEYVFNIKENTHKGITIGYIKARSFSGASLYYRVVHGKAQSKFTLDSNTGRLALPSPLDYERDSNLYYLRIRAEEVGSRFSRRQSSEVNVQIFLKDINDNAPEFSQQRYRYNLPESVPVGTTVLSVSAHDSDSGINGQFRYYVESPFFAVNLFTGEITTTKPLDYETASSHTFVVVAQDGGNPALNGTARVEVTLRNVNDNPPRFTQAIYNEFVTEDAGPGELVTTVQASDLDLDPVSYSIMSGDNRSNFVIESRTGVVRLVKHRQPNLVGPLYILNISASDGLHLSQAVLVVVIQDINNHKPVFKDCHTYRPVIAEDIGIGSSVIQVSAEDGDMGDNGKVSYHIERPTDGMAYFEIDSDTGLVTTARTFDREKKRSYPIRIMGKDGGTRREEAERLMGFCQVEITIDDVNDHPPKFGNKIYKTNVKENLEKGQIVLHVSATDEDAGSNALITYSFERPNLQFRISNASGVITTRRKLKFSEYRFSVIARDNGNPRKQSRADIVINVYKAGKNPPKFSKSVYTARVREDVLPGRNVTSVHATSPDPNIMIFYTIVNYPQPFHIDPVKGVVRSVWALDYEKAANYTVHIRAQDTQNPPLVAFAQIEILVEDVNDSPPEFPVSRYEGQVAENSPAGSSVIEVKAVDPDTGDNGRVSYKFLRTESYDSFGLDPVTGLITTKKVFDRERTGRYTLIVEARDSGNISKASSCLVDVIINDKNDQTPAFERSVYNVSVFEDVARGTRILTVTAIDGDIGNNAVVNYYITSGNKGAAFAINKELGQIVVASSLDRETKDYYQLKIRALDGRNAGTTVVNIRIEDVNDNNPKFSNNSYVAYVYENQSKGSYVTTLSATDNDLGLGGKFLFSISGQGRNAFEIDPSTGVMRTTKLLDRESKARYVFLAFATDNPDSEAGSRRTGSCDVEIRIRDKNDNPPRFPDGEYEGGVQENQPPGKEVMTLSAVDDDDPNENGNAILSYELLDDSEGLFAIDIDSGLITTRATLDRESRDEYRLVVKATDRGEPALSGETEVKVIVTDANDHAPRFVQKTFHASVFENASIDSSVILLNATDEDIGINAKLKFSIVENDVKGEEEGRRMFRIVDGTGELRVARSLDYETESDYLLKVTVRDSGIPSFSDTAEVKILIQDNNDNPPVFSPVGYGVKVREDIPPGSYIMSVSARDSDSGINKEFKFSISEGDPEGQFRIDPDNGHVYVNRGLDRESQESYLLTIRATNTAFPPLYGHATMKVTLNDVNDNGPTFHPSEFHFSVKENTAPSQTIGTISVDDPDGDPLNGPPFFFEIVSGNDDGFFALDNRTGEFFTKSKFDREEQDVYTLIIRASDGGTPRQSSDTRVFVHISDTNDNPHSPGTLKLVLNSYQGKFPGGRVGKVYVVDKDIDDRRNYEVVTNDSNYFTVERLTGMIRSHPNPPKGRYFLTIRVSDASSSFSEVICSVIIEVKEITAEAVHNSMAIRLSGVQREEFVSTILPRFKESVASILQTNEDNVDLFSVQNAPKTVNALDVRFAAHGSPYYAPERMTAILKNSRPNLSKALQHFRVNVLVIGVDECLYETCESGGCTNVLLANGEVEVISVKKTSFASIVAILTAKCGDCDAQKKKEVTCNSKPCFNGGTCEKIPEGYICRCLGGYDGPDCELTTRSFEPGEWVWLPPPQQCSVGSLSLEFASREANGLLLYGGPTSPVGNGDVYDFITVELSGGKVLVSLSLGDPHDVLRLSLTSGITLNDGEWHHVDVFRDKTFVRVTVDKCRGAPVTKTKAKAVEDRSRCSSTARMKNDKNKMLNLNGPLQLGGISNKHLRYPELTTTHYKGCIRNVVSQSKYYDLKNPSLKNGTKERCPMMDQHCKQHQCHSRATCVPSWTGYACSCPFGRTGRTCGQGTRALNYADGSFTQYLFHLHEFDYDPRETKIRMQIRTRDPNGGILMYNAGSEEGRFSSLEVVPYDINGDGERELIVTYTLGSGKGGRAAAVQLTGVNVGDGQWHNISVLRERRLLKLSVDSDSDGYTVTEHLGAEHALFGLDPTRIFIGGLHPSFLSRRRKDDAKDFVGCINDVQFNGYPLDFYNGTSNLGNAISVGVSEGCSAEPVCTPNPCISSEWCRDIWRKFVCLPRLCASRPCRNGGSCVEGVDSEGNSKFLCRCPRSFEGALCEVQSSVVVATDSGIGLENGLIIGLSVLVVTLVLSVCILILYLRRSRPKRLDVSVGEEPFKRDNVANYRIEGGGEEDVEDHLRDILRSFETGDFSPCQSSFKLSGSSSDVSGPYVIMAEIKKEAEKKQRDEIPGGSSKPVQKPVEPVPEDAGSSFPREGSDEELPDSCSSPSAVSTSERRRRVCPSSKGSGEIKDRQTPEGGESGVDGSPTRKLMEVFGLSEEEQAGRRSPPEGFSSPERRSSLGKRERGNGASLTRPAKTDEDGKMREQNCERVCEPQAPKNESFAVENPLSRPNSELRSASKEDGLAPVQRHSLPPRKPPRSYFPRGAPPTAGTLLPDDSTQKFCYEGSGSPTISLSTLGDTDGDSEADDSYDYVNGMGDKFKKLARIYGLPPAVSFSPHNEVIGE